jgi:hypothetical protein
LTALKKTFEPGEQQMVEVKYAGKQFGKMEWDELNKWSKALLIKINAITGWVVPEMTLEILVDQFRKKLSESYNEVNPDEIEYAFRHYGTVVKDWGKQMNLSLIDEVMIPYLERRLEVSKKEEIIAMNKEPEQIENREDLSDLSMADWFKAKVRQIELDSDMPLAYCPLGLYEWLDKIGKIKKTGKEKYEYVDKAVDVRHTQLSEAVAGNNSHDNRKALADFNKMKEQGHISGDEIIRVENIAKQLILKEILLDRDFRL